MKKFFNEFKTFAMRGNVIDLAVAGPLLTITITGNAFLYNMVRIIAGTLVEIGLGKLETDAFRRAFDSRSRLELGVTAPASGLELTEVFYPPLAFSDPDSLRWHEEE